MRQNRQGKRLTPEARETAQQMIAQGYANTQIADKVGCSEGSVRNIRRRVDAERRAQHEQAPAQSVPVAPEPKRTDAAQDTLSRTKMLFEKSMSSAETAEQDGNHSAAARFQAEAGRLAILIARLEKAKADNQDAVTIPREELSRLARDVRERVRTLADVPLTCPECGRAMRIKSVKEAVEKS